MVIQQLNIARDEQSQSLYYGISGQVDVDKRTGIVRMMADSSLHTGTYFGALSIDKWRQYTMVRDIWFCFEYQGECELEMIAAKKIGDTIREEPILSMYFTSGGVQKARVCIPQDILAEIIYYRISSGNKGVVLSDLRYEGDVKDIRDVCIALNICTYKREKYLLRNVEQIRHTFLANMESELYGHLQVFIIDNGQSLSQKEFSEAEIHLFSNPNLGGAGGFSKGLAEIAKVKDLLGITNVILMDDDIVLEPEAVLRTYRLLRMLKPEYFDAFIGGAMLRLQEPTVQHENGASWNGGACRFYGRGWDLSELPNLVRNEVPEEREYAAWWYCCVPAKVVREDNLALPLFIHEDDVEYSLRNADGILTMNGIGVWHVSAESKRPSTNEYYDLRNLYIVNAIHEKTFTLKAALVVYVRKLIMALLSFRYRDMNIVYQAVRDFGKGPEWLFSLDTVEYHRQLQKMGYHNEAVQVPEGVKQIPSLGLRFKHLGWKRKLKIIFSLNGWLQQGRKEDVFYPFNVNQLDLYRVKHLVLVDDGGKGIRLERQFHQIFVMLWYLIKGTAVLCTKFQKMKKEYYLQCSRLQSMEYWRSAFGGKSE